MNSDSDFQFIFDEAKSFEERALRVFRFQYLNQEVYRQFCDFQNKNPETVNSLMDIPFLPISFFKNREIICAERGIELVFRSSGTTGSEFSHHHVVSESLYKESILNGFQQYYGSPLQYHFIALLPGYLEQPHSSLVYMFKFLMEQSNAGEYSFYKKVDEDLMEVLKGKQRGEKKTFLIGVTYSLLDLSEKFSFADNADVIVMETGGMKGRRKEMIREELHSVLESKLNVKTIHSEYGMTELLSQAYSTGKGIFRTSNTMRVFVSEINDPLSIHDTFNSGRILIADLSNFYSCSFIQTDDFGFVYNSENFEIRGRIQGSISRGCNLMYE